jgi:hypothetical protein
LGSAFFRLSTVIFGARLHGLNLRRAAANRKVTFKFACLCPGDLDLVCGPLPRESRCPQRVRA